MLRFRMGKIVLWLLTGILTLGFCVFLPAADSGVKPPPAFSLSYDPCRYSGYYTDSESGLCYCKARYYSPGTGRFISRDTYDLPNRYAYCDGEPVSKTDPEGHFSGQNVMNYCLSVADIMMGATVLTVTRRGWRAPMVTGTKRLAWGGILCGFAGLVTQIASDKCDIDSLSWASTGFAGTGFMASLYSITKYIRLVSNVQKTISDIATVTSGYETKISRIESTYKKLMQIQQNLTMRSAAVRSTLSKLTIDKFEKDGTMDSFTICYQALTSTDCAALNKITIDLLETDGLRALHKELVENANRLKQQLLNKYKTVFGSDFALFHSS